MLAKVPVFREVCFRITWDPGRAHSCLLPSASLGTGFKVCHITFHYACVVSKWWSIFYFLRFPHFSRVVLFFYPWRLRPAEFSSLLFVVMPLICTQAVFVTLKGTFLLLRTLFLRRTMSTMASVLFCDSALRAAKNNNVAKKTTVFAFSVDVYKKKLSNPKVPPKNINKGVFLGAFFSSVLFCFHV